MGTASWKEGGAIGRLAALPIVASLALAVPTPTRFLLLQAFLLRRLHVRHILAVLAENAAPIHLPSEAFECAIDRLVISYLNTNSQRKSLLEKSDFGM